MEKTFLLINIFVFSLTGCAPLVMFSDYKDKDASCSNACVSKYSDCISNATNHASGAEKQAHCRNPYEACINACN